MGDSGQALRGRFQDVRARHLQSETAPGLLRGTSETLRATLEQAHRVIAHDDITVLIQGETGTGKSMLARAMHNAGPRGCRPFVAVNCAALPPTLLESELFGHERGAFTGAVAHRAGLIREAEGGTLFLDEIRELAVGLQAKLLRFLDDKRVRPVGGTGSVEVDVRVIAAANTPLDDAVAQGAFRADLFYRLNVVVLELPPLRERPEDLELLTRHFATTLAEHHGVPVPRINRRMLEVLSTHSWPGNVRELRNAVERALILSPPGTLDPAFLPFHSHPVAPARGDDIPPMPLREILREVVTRVVRRHDGNKSAAARQLEISRSRLQRLLHPPGPGSGKTI